MFTGVSLDQALRHWKNGKDVIVLDRTIKSPSGGYETYSLDKLFENLFGSITLFGEPKETLFVPKECVLLRDGKLYVFRKNQEGVFLLLRLKQKNCWMEGMKSYLG